MQTQSTQTRVGSEKSHIEWLFDELTARYGSKFVAQWDGTNVSPLRVKHIWADGLKGLTVNEIRAGLAACGKFPPTLPEFRDLCRSPVTAEAAFHEAVEQISKRHNGTDVWSSPGVYWTAMAFGEFDLKNFTWSAARGRWVHLFEKFKTKTDPVPKKLVELPAPGKAITDRETARKNLSNILQILAPKVVGGGHD